MKPSLGQAKLNVVIMAKLLLTRPHGHWLDSSELDSWKEKAHLNGGHMEIVDQGQTHTLEMKSDANEASFCNFRYNILMS